MKFPNSSYWCIGPVLFSMVLMQCNTVSLKSNGLMTQLAAVTLVDRIVALAVFFAALHGNVDAQYALYAALICGSITASVIGYKLSPRLTRRFFSSWKLTSPWSGSLAYGLGGLALSAQRLDVNILQFVAGSSAVGIYGAVNRWTQPLGIFASAFATTGLPIVARNKSIKRSYSALKHSWWLLGLASLSCILVAVFSSNIVRLLLGAEYSNSADVLAVLAIGTIPSLLNQPLYVFLQAINEQKQATIGTMLAVGLQLLGCALLGWQYGAFGAACALALSQFVLLFIFIFILVRYEKKKPNIVTMSIGVSL